MLIKKESERIRNKNWEKNLISLARHYSEPKIFWAQITRLKGNQTPANQYLIKDNIKLTEDKDEEKAHREV